MTNAILGLAAVVLTFAYAVPQPVRLLRTRNAAGVSLAGLTCSCVSTTAWLAYAVHVGDVWVLASSAVYVPCLVVAVWLAWRCGADAGAAWLPLLYASVLAAALGVDLVAGAQLFALVLGISTMWRIAPSAWSAWRTGDVSGVAPGAWWTLLLYGCVFLAYGLRAGVAASVVNALVCVIGGVVVLGRLTVDRFDVPGSQVVRRRWAQAPA